MKKLIFLTILVLFCIFFIYSSTHAQPAAPAATAEPDTQAQDTSLTTPAASILGFNNPLSARLGGPSDDPHAGDTVKSLFRITLALADAVVIVFFLVIAFATILHIQYDTYGVKKALPALILGIVMAHFSLFMVRSIVDVAQVATQSFFDAAGRNPVSDQCVDDSSTGGQLACNLSVTIIQGGVRQLVTGNDSGTHLTTRSLFGLTPFGWLQAIALTNPGGMFIMGLIYLVIMAVPAILIIILSFLLYIRVYMIIFLAVVAPIAFICIQWTPVQGLFKKWWQNFTKFVFMGPLVMFFIWVSIEFFGASHAQGAPAADFGSYLLTLIMIYMAITTPFTLGGAVMSAWGGAGKKYGTQAVGLGFNSLNSGLNVVAKKPFGNTGRTWGEVTGIMGPKTFVKGVQGFVKGRTEKAEAFPLYVAGRRGSTGLLTGALEQWDNVRKATVGKGGKGTSVFDRMEGSKYGFVQNAGAGMKNRLAAGDVELRTKQRAERLNRARQQTMKTEPELEKEMNAAKSEDDSLDVLVEAALNKSPIYRKLKKDHEERFLPKVEDVDPADPKSQERHDKQQVEYDEKRQELKSLTNAALRETGNWQEMDADTPDEEREQERVFEESLNREKIRDSVPLAQRNILTSQAEKEAAMNAINHQLGPENENSPEQSRLLRLELMRLTSTLKTNKPEIKIDSRISFSRGADAQFVRGRGVDRLTPAQIEQLIDERNPAPIRQLGEGIQGAAAFYGQVSKSDESEIQKLVNANDSLQKLAKRLETEPIPARASTSTSSTSTAQTEQQPAKPAILGPDGRPYKRT